METSSRLCKHAIVLSLTVLVVALLAVPVFADTTFTDSTFNLGNYTQSSVYLQDPTSNLNVQQCTNCGNPGLGLQIISTNVKDSVVTAVGLYNNLFNYDPSTQGAITSIDASVDKDLSFNFINMSMTPAGNTFRPLIFQDGVFYLAAIPGPGIGFGQDTTGYNNISQNGLSAASFLSFDFATGQSGTANPNFGGDTMFFGLGQIFTTGTGGIQENLEADYDNLNVTLHTVPEPNSLILLGLGFAAVVLIPRRTRRQI